MTGKLLGWGLKLMIYPVAVRLKHWAKGVHERLSVCDHNRLLLDEVSLGVTDDGMSVVITCLKCGSKLE